MVNITLNLLLQEFRIASYKEEVLGKTLLTTLNLLLQEFRIAS